MLNVITLFSGYDSQCLALNRLGLPYDLAAWCEIDRHAITAHNALFPQWSGRNLGDVSRVDWAEWHRQHPQPIDLLTYSSPCQDFSSAGLQRGGEEGSGTRSGLLWETERAVRELRPRHLVFENVGGLVSGKFIDLFQRWQARLNGYGYTNFQQLMNAKDYGVPQNRLRIFMVSILDCPRAYYFPQPFPLTRRLKDVLEQNVDERYYLKEESVERLFSANKEMFDKGNGFSFRPSMPPHNDIATSLMVTHGWRRDDNFVAEPTILTPVRTEYGKAIRKQYGDNNLPESRHNLTQLQPKQDGTSNTLTSVAKDNLFIVPSDIQRVGRYNNGQSGIVYGTKGVSPTIDASAPEHGRGVQITEGIRIRRLTERELYRLMDVSEPDIDTLLAAPIPRTQHAKLAGNSIVVAYLYYIFRNLFVTTEPAAGTQTKLF